MLLQERINELGSAIINIRNRKIHLTGFMSSERLLDYYEKGNDCRLSMGVYSIEEYNVAYGRDNALFIVLEDNIEVSRYEFRLIKNDTIKYKDEDNKPRTKVYKIRYCKYSNMYNYKDIDKSILFNNEEELLNYFLNEYNVQLQLD